MSYAACHHAGRPKQWLLASDTGVFVGQCNNDWAKFSSQRPANPYTGPGTHSSISSNRVSYSLGLRGCSVSVDTACSSSLVALDIACQKLGQLGGAAASRLGAALCTGVQLNLIAEPFVAFGKARAPPLSGSMLFRVDDLGRKLSCCEFRVFASSGFVVCAGLRFRSSA